MKISFPGSTKAINIDPTRDGGITMHLHDGDASMLLDLDHASALVVAKAIEENARKRT